MQRLPIYILPTPKQRRRAAWRRLLPGALLATVVLIAFAVSGAQRGDAELAPAGPVAASAAH
jgi:hypothetical protein